MAGRRPRPAAASLAFAFLPGLLATSCGSPNGGPNPHPTQTPPAFTGRYTLTLVPAPVCSGGAVSFPAEVTATSSLPHPGVQLLLVGCDPAVLELELEYVDNTLAGGVGSIGVPSTGGAEFYLNAIANGAVTQTSDRRGEVLSGTLRGYMEIGDDVMPACDSPNHSFTLRAQ